MATKEELLGSLVVVGITYEAIGADTRLHQVAGVIERVDDDVIELRESDGTAFSLPPAPDAFEPANPGVYTLRATGERITDPAYTAMFTVSPPVPAADVQTAEPQ